MSKKERRNIRASCTAVLAQARWLISLENGRRLMVRLLALRGSLARGVAGGALATALALSPLHASGPFEAPGAEPLGAGRPAFVDIDDDGDLDALVGTSDGFVRYFRNDSGAGPFDFPTAFTEQTGADNPFDGIDFGSYASPDFVDIDGDSDQDVFIGSGFPVTLRYFRNEGSPSLANFVEQSGASHPLDGVAAQLDDTDEFVTPTFADLGDDGDQDAFFGRSNGTVTYFENIGSGTAPDFAATGDDNALDGVDGGSYVVVEFADLNADGLLDVMLANYDGNVLYFENSGSTTAPDFSDQSGVSNPFAGINLERQAALALEDIDNDGDQDAFLGDKNDALLFFRNEGTAQVAEFNMVDGNPLFGKSVGAYSRPDFGDVDNDGDFDVVIGNSAGRVSYFRNNGSSTAPNFFIQTELSDPLAGVDVGQHSHPALADINGDGKLDVFVGEYDGAGSAEILYLRNDSTAEEVIFTEQAGENNPLNAFAATNNNFAAPAPVDIDGNGTIDVFVGLQDGTVTFYRNDGTATEPDLVAQSGENNPLAAVDVTGDFAYAMPTFVDFDNDGDLDAFIGSKSDQVLFYRNTGDATNPSFSLETPANDPFPGQSVGPTFADIDADGDPDAFSGTNSGGTINYFENLAVPTAPDALSATAVTTDQVDLSWTDTSNVETGFVIERSPDGTGNWIEIATPAADASSYSDTGLTDNTTYFYRIRTVNGNFNSSFSAAVSATTLATAPQSPANLSGRSDTPGTATISWDNPGGNIGGFVVERSSDGGETWEEVASLPASTTSFTDTGLELETDYQYRVISVGSSGAPDSPPSDPVTVTTIPALVYLPLVYLAP